jgi:excisionase family DNA binding protein
MDNGSTTEPQPLAPVFLTAKQVAELLQVSEKSVLRWAAADPTMPALRIGRTLRFDRDRLLAWFRSNTQGFGRPGHTNRHMRTGRNMQLLERKRHSGLST